MKREDSGMRIWVDDERPMPSDWVGITHHFKTSAAAVLWLEHLEGEIALLPDDRREPFRAMFFTEVSLDHDLGGDDNGFVVLDWMIEHDLWPNMLTIHTANIPARQRMLAAANAESPDWVDMRVIYW